MKLPIFLIPDFYLERFKKVWEDIMFGEPILSFPETPPYTYDEIVEELGKREEK